jgi:hypothetical protein
VRSATAQDGLYGLAVGTAGDVMRLTHGFAARANFDILMGERFERIRKSLA